jgi:hypothetical protein
MFAIGARKDARDTRRHEKEKGDALSRANMAFVKA